MKFSSLLKKYIFSDTTNKFISPLIFIRERFFEDFSIYKNLPTRPSKIFTDLPSGICSMLKVQEVLNPTVFDNIKKALHQLMTQNFNKCRN